MNSMMNKIFRSKETIMVLEEVLCGFETFIKKDLREVLQVDVVLLSLFLLWKR